jgi:hypothetical protein
MDDFHIGDIVTIETIYGVVEGTITHIDNEKYAALVTYRDPYGRYFSSWVFCSFLKDKERDITFDILGESCG